MSEYTEVEQPFLQQLASLGWTIIDQVREIPQDPGKSLRRTFRQWLLPDVFSGAVSAINTTAGDLWLTEKQLHDLHDQILRQPGRTLLEANEAVQQLLFKAQVDCNEVTGEQDPVVRLIDFANPENNQFHIDLEDQLSRTATLIGGRVHIIENTSALRRQLSPDSSDINMVMVHKFQQREESLSLKVAEALGTYQAMPSGKTFGVVNESERILLMIDEAHRTQGSDMGDNIFEAFPNAVRIAFTGTPLITERHGERKTYKCFDLCAIRKIYATSGS